MPISTLFSRRSILILGLILLVGLGARLFLILHAPTFTAYIDSLDYFYPGYRLAQDGQFELLAKRAPLYALFLGGTIATLGPSLEPAASVQHLLGLASVVLVYALGALAFGRPTGLLAALGVALNGALLLTEHSIASEALYTPLLLASLLLVLLGVRTGRWPLFLLAGLSLGLTALTRPVGQALLPLVLGALLLQRRAWRQRLATAGLLGFGFLLVVTPWIVRNALVNEVSATAGGLGDALYARVRRHDASFTFQDRGTPPAAPEAAALRKRVFQLAQQHKFGPEVRRALEKEFQLTPTQSDHLLREAALQVIRQEPARYLRGTASMFTYLWLGFEKSIDDFWETRAKPKWAQAWPRSIRFVMGPDDRLTEQNRARVEALVRFNQDYRFSGLLAVLTLLGSARCLTGWRQHGLVLLLLPAVVVTQLLVYAALDGPLYRYRVPMQPLITLLAAGGLTWLASQARTLLSARAAPRNAPAESGAAT
jgi:4-amino-4-deoxy-L-arabinose transferase-like glycosyltransferase